MGLSRQANMQHTPHNMQTALLFPTSNDLPKGCVYLSLSMCMGVYITFRSHVHVWYMCIPNFIGTVILRQRRSVSAYLTTSALALLETFFCFIKNRSFRRIE
jgi:hypothetical protein